MSEKGKGVYSKLQSYSILMYFARFVSTQYTAHENCTLGYWDLLGKDLDEETGTPGNPSQHLGQSSPSALDALAPAGGASIGSASPLDPLDPLDAACRVACRRPCPRTARAVVVQVGRMSVIIPFDVAEKNDMLDTSGAD